MDYSIFDKAFYKLFEKNAEINFIDRDKSTFPLAKSKFGRLKSMVMSLDKHGSHLLGEKIGQILFGAHNLNYYDLSYPFVDIIVKDPVEGYSEKNELISIKTSSTKYSLKNATTDVNGFKISQFLNYLLKNLNFYVYRSGTEAIAGRNAYKTGTVLATYVKMIEEISQGDAEKYTQYYFSVLGYLALLKEFLDKYNEKEKKMVFIKGNVFRWLYAIFIISNPSEKNHINSLLKKTVKKQLVPNPITEEELNMVRRILGRDILPEAKDIKFLIPDDLKKKKVSYCVFYFNKYSNNNTDQIVLNCAKTTAITIEELYEKSFELWREKGKHIKSLERSKGKSKFKNIYFNYENILEIFEDGRDSFKDHIKIIISKSDKRDKYTEEHQEAIIQVIDKIKGDYSPQAGELANYLNNLMDLWYEEDEKKKIIVDFKKFINNIEKRREIKSRVKIPDFIKKMKK
jgi:hypothetical protein